MTSSRMSDTANEAVKQEIDALRGEVKRLADLVADIAKKSTDRATHTFQDAVDATKDTASDVTDAFVKGTQRASDELSRHIDPITSELAASVERNPLTALMIAAGLGLVVGLLTRQGN